MDCIAASISACDSSITASTVPPSTWLPASTRISAMLPASGARNPVKDFHRVDHQQHVAGGHHVAFFYPDFVDHARQRRHERAGRDLLAAARETAAARPAPTRPADCRRKTCRPPGARRRSARRRRLSRRTCSGAADVAADIVERFAIDPQLQPVALEAIFDRDLAACGRESSRLLELRGIVSPAGGGMRAARWPRGVARPGAARAAATACNRSTCSSPSGAASAAGSCRTRKCVSVRPARKLGMLEHAHQQLAIGAQAVNLRAGQRVGQPPGRFGARGRVDDHLGQHRVVVRRDDSPLRRSPNRRAGPRPSGTRNRCSVPADGR